jgi:6-phosphofructokinase 2
MPDIVTLTLNPTIDKSTNVDSVASEIKMRCTEPTFDPGGGGINVSRVVKILGGQSLAVYTAGGFTGNMLTKLLDEVGLEQHAVPVQGLTRENLTVYEESTTLQYRFNMPGPTMQESEWSACIDAVFAHPASYIVASGSLAPGIPDDFYKQLALRAKEIGSLLIVDTSGKALEACAEAGVFLLKPNLHELELLSGERFESEERMIEIARNLIRSGMAQVFVISMGASGAVLITADDAVKMRPPVVPIKSKVGAGDSMVGGIVWALAEGKSLFDSVRYGIAAGSATVMSPGTHLCKYEDVMHIIDRIAIVS